MIVSANDLCRTRLCRGDLCEREAEPYSRFCWVCERKESQKHLLEQRRKRARNAAYQRDYRARINRELHAMRAADDKRKRDRERRRRISEANVAAGLTARGTPRIYAPRATA